MNYHEIKDFKGLFTNADTDDIPNEYLTALSNLRPVFGKLTKTFGAGKLFTNAETPANEALPETPNNIATFMNSMLVYNAMLGNAQISITVNSSTKVVTLYVYDKSALDWVALDDLVDVVFSGTYYHKYARNAYFQYADQLRLLPGNVAKADGTNVSRGIWLGYIDRDYFDGAYSPDGKFYDYPADLTAPTVSGLGATIYARDCGLFNVENDPAFFRFYKFSYVYDGVQESLLSDCLKVNLEKSQITEIDLAIAEATHNKRITAIRVYRAQYETGPYYLIHTIDLLRASGQYNTYTSLGYYGVESIHLSNVAYSFTAGHEYMVSFDKDVLTTTAVEIDNPGNGVKDQLHVKDAETNIAATYWNNEWSIWEYQTVRYVNVASATSGAYAGVNVFTVNTDIGNGTYIGGLLAVLPGSAFVTPLMILNNYKKAILFLDEENTTRENLVPGGYEWATFSLTNGVYNTTEVTGTHTYRFYDISFPDQIQYPLGLEKSIHTNAEFALVVGNRCWLANMVIDPTTKAEVRTDIGGYSELGQVDVVPAGNTVPLEDREGGECTGLSEMFGDPVYLKKHALITIFSRNNPDDPLKWRPFTSVHNIGNFAKRGYIVVAGVLYVCSADGIYGVSPNNLAEADSTPTKTLKISGKIENSYLALTQAQKEAITVVFDQNLSEIIWNLNGTYFHYNTVTGEWRNTTMTPTMTLADYDGYGNAIIYSTSQNKMYKIGTAETVIGSFTTKDFVISDLRKDVVRYMWVKYKSTVALTVSLYLDGSSSAETTTYTLAASTTETVARVRISCRCKRLRVKIAESSATATATEIAMVRIEHEGEGR